MEKITLYEAIELYDNGQYDLRQVYNACETDLDMYNFFGNHLGLDCESIKTEMKKLTGTDDAYENALYLAEID